LQLILDDIELGSFNAADKKYLEEFINVETLGLNGCNLSKLDHFPNASHLTRLELAENVITGADLVNLKHLVNLETLKLGSNQIKDVKSLESIKCLSNLKNIDLLSNDVTQEADYRKKVFEMFPLLEVLDGTNQEGEEVDSEDEFGGEGGEDEMLGGEEWNKMSKEE